MSSNKTVRNAVRLTVLAAIVTMMMASAAFAQQKVCINLLAGAGYAAKMYVIVGSVQSQETSSFPIGQTKCITLSDVVPAGTEIKPGTEITTKIKAILGRTETCTPDKIKYDPKRTDNIVYNAKGTTQNVKCNQ
ncbi:MAG: hypothetical protein WCG31_01395 [Deltaproteobacteria bacterium]|jgi:hypothetical protein